MNPRSTTSGRDVTIVVAACEPIMQALEVRMLLAVHTPMTGTAFQTALNNAALGDTIILDAGTTYTGQFTLPNKTTGSGWITIESSELDKLPGEGVRVNPADAIHMARLQAPGSNASVIRTPGQGSNPNAVPPTPAIPGSPSHHFKFVGIEFVGPANNSSLTALIELGTSTDAQVSYTSVPHDIIIDRCYMRPNTPTASIRRAIALNSASTDITNCYIEEFHQSGSDSQAIGGWNGPGPYNIINNRLEGASENIMFGGDTARLKIKADGTEDGVIPSDIVIRGNHIIKPVHWRGAGYNVKNLFELKAGRRVLVENNILENCWVDGQTGYALVLKLGDRATTPWNVTEDITIRNNLVRNAYGAVTVQGRDYASGTSGDPGGNVRRLSITNNVFANINGSLNTPPTTGGNFNILITHGPKDLTFDHNTFINAGTAIETENTGYVATNFKFTNNIIGHSQYGVRSTAGTGNATFAAYYPDPEQFKTNLLVDVNYTYRNSYTTRPENFLIKSPNDDSDWASNTPPVPPPGDTTPTGYSRNPELWNSVGFVDYANANFRLAATSPYVAGKPGPVSGTLATSVGADFNLIEQGIAGVANGVLRGTAGANDNLYLRKLGNGQFEIIKDKGLATEAVVLRDYLSYYQSFNFNMLDGDDSVTVDHTGAGGSPIPVTTGAVTRRGVFIDGGTSSAGDALHLIGNGGTATYEPDDLLTGKGTVSANGTISFVAAEGVTASGLSNFTLVTPKTTDVLNIDSPTVGQNRVGGTSGGLSLTPATLVSAVGLTIDSSTNDAVGGSDDSVTINAPSLSTVRFIGGAGNDSMTVNGGTLGFNTDLRNDTTNLALIVGAGGTVNLGSTQHLRDLNVAGQASLSAGGSKLLVTKGLAVSGRLDLADNDLLLDYSSGNPLGGFNGTNYTGVLGLVASGHNYGSWDGNGLVSSMPDAQMSLTTLAADTASNAFGLPEGQTMLYEGETIDASTVVVKYTYAGDANFDGQIDAGDYGVIDFFIQIAGSDGYGKGDFNYDGFIDAGDYGTIDNNVQHQGAIL